eukprot:gene12989-8837_t
MPTRTSSQIFATHLSDASKAEANSLPYTSLLFVTPSPAAKVLMDTTLDCPFCTFKNNASRTRCQICQKNIRKRNRPPETTTESTKTDLHPGFSGKINQKLNTIASSRTQSAASPSITHDKGIQQAKQANDHMSSSLPGALASASPSAPPSGEAPNEGRMGTLFTTASGQAVTVSDKHFRAAEAKLMGSSTSLPGALASASPSAPPSGEAPNEGRMGTLFTTASGQAVTVSDKHFRAAEAKLMGSSTSLPGALASASPSAPPSGEAPNEGRMGTLFTTASGQAVTVSDKHFRAAEAKLMGSSTSLPGALASASPSAPPSGEAPNEGRMGTLFTTASGQAVTVSDKHFRAAEAKLMGSSTSLPGALASASPSAPPSGEAPNEGRMGTLFTTASGQAVTVSDKHFRAAEAKLMGSSTSLPGALASASPSAPPSGEAPNEGRMGTLFTTASGQAVTVSDKHFRAAEAKLMGSSTSLPGALASASPSAPPSGEAPNEGRMGTLFTTASGQVKCEEVVGHRRTNRMRRVDVEDFVRQWDTTKLGNLRVGGSSETQWGLEDWRSTLILFGADASWATVEWCCHALLSALYLLCSLDSRNPTDFCCSALGVALCLCRQYNKEVTNPGCSVLQQMVSRRISSASPCILFISSINMESGRLHTKSVTLSDGFYHVLTALDVPLSDLLRKGVLREGTRLFVCGAKLRSSEWSVDTLRESVVLSINFNCVRKVHALAALGVLSCEPLPVPVSMTRSDGGIVPAIEGLIVAHLPDTFILCQNTSKRLYTVCNRSYYETCSDKNPNSWYRMSSCLACCDGKDVMLQHWSVSAPEKDGGTQFPPIGSRSVFYALHPGGSGACGLPYLSAVAFFTTSSLHFRVSHVPAEPWSIKSVDTWRDPVSRDAPGSSANIVGLYIASLSGPFGSVALIRLESERFAMVLYPAASDIFRTAFLCCPEFTSVVIQHLTYVCYEDPKLDSDCSLLTVNPFSIWEPSERYLSQTNNADGIQEKLQRTRFPEGQEKALRDRASVIFNYWSSFNSEEIRQRFVVPFSVDPCKNLALNTSSPMEGKIPYYLKYQEKRQGSTAEKTLQKAEGTSMAMFADFGNIISLSATGFASCMRGRDKGSLNRWALFDALLHPEEFEASWATFAQQIDQIQIKWRFGPDPRDWRRAVIKDGSVFHQLIQAAIPINSLAFELSDARCTATQEAREALLSLWKRVPQYEEQLWFRAVKQSVIVPQTYTVVHGITPMKFPWTRKEWQRYIQLCVGQSRGTQRRSKKIFLYFLELYCRFNILNIRSTGVHRDKHMLNNSFGITLSGIFFTFREVHISFN